MGPSPDQAHFNWVLVSLNLSCSCCCTGARALPALEVFLSTMQMDAYARELMKPARKPAAYAPVWADGVDDVWGMDLADMQEWQASNNGYKYILVIVDVFSRYAWAFPLKDKTAAAVWDAFSSEAAEGRPHAIWVDRGSEFYNKTWDARLKASTLGATRRAASTRSALQSASSAR